MVFMEIIAFGVLNISNFLSFFKTLHFIYEKLGSQSVKVIFSLIF